VSRSSGKIFGQNIYRLRNAADLTQEKLAEKADVSRRYIQLIEAGRYVPTIEVASRLRKALGTDWVVLLKGL
jgi:transcriptional regulator with XRE-family HTH domain